MCMLDKPYRRKLWVQNSCTPNSTNLVLPVWRAQSVRHRLSYKHAPHLTVWSQSHWEGEVKIRENINDSGSSGLATFLVWISVFLFSLWSTIIASSWHAENRILPLFCISVCMNTSSCRERVQLKELTQYLLTTSYERAPMNHSIYYK